jgi:hypothetical protein
MSDVQELIEKLQSPKASQRYDACEELRVASSIPAEALAALRVASQDSDPEVADAASRALAAHDEALSKATAELGDPISHELNDPGPEPAGPDAEVEALATSDDRAGLFA